MASSAPRSRAAGMWRPNVRVLACSCACILALQQLLLRARFASRSVVCLDADTAAPPPGVHAQPAFVMIWSTDVALFGLISRRSVESIFFHHPNASLRVYSNTLPETAFSEMRAAGYAVSVRRYNVTALLHGTPAAPWLDRLHEWQRGLYFYSHLSDVLRLALLYREGGVYLDTDVLLARPLRLAAVPSTLRHPPPRASHGRPGDDGSSASGGSSSSSALPRGGGASALLRDGLLGVESYAEGDLSRAVLNGAILYFEAGSPFLRSAMHEFAASYNPLLWGWNGPELLTRVRSRCGALPGSTVQVEPPVAFYPIYWGEVQRFAGDAEPERQADMWATIQRSSYAVHLWNKKTSNLNLSKRSLLHRLLHTWVVLPPTPWVLS